MASGTFEQMAQWLKVLSFIQYSTSVQGVCISDNSTDIVSLMLWVLSLVQALLYRESNVTIHREDNYKIWNLQERF